MYLQRSRKNQTSFGNFDGNYNFGDNSSNPYDTNFGFANAAIGVYNSFSQAANMVNGQYRYWNLEFYLQDTWKVSSRLTLDYGIRSAWYQPQYDVSLQASTFVLSQWSAAQAPRLFQPAIVNGVRSALDPQTGQSLPAAFIGYIVPNTGSITNGIAVGGNSFTKYLQNSPPLQWGPRVGVAWDITGKQSLVLRTGAGIYYDRYQGNRVFDFVRNPPLGIEPVLNYGFVNTISPSNALLSPPNFYAADPVGKVPTVYNFTLGLQTKLPYGMVLDTAYVGALFRHLQDNRNLNPVPYGATLLPQNQDPTLSSIALLGSSALPQNFLRPLRGIGSATICEGAATGNYNSAQVSLNRRYGNLFLGVAYNWSKDLTTASGDTSAFRVDQYNRMANYGPASNDRRHNFAINYVYNLPRMRDKGVLTRAILGGWQISGVTRFLSGSPITPGYSISRAGCANITGSNTEGARIGVISGVSPNTGTDDPYNRINPAAFTYPRVGSLGLESGVCFLTGPGINNWDISLQKEFSIKERAKLQFRIDTFNTFNHTQFSGINSTLNFTAYPNPTPSNLYLKADGTINNINGFGTVNGARDPRILQTMIRFEF